jgi:hypothetical protein
MCIRASAVITQPRSAPNSDLGSGAVFAPQDVNSAFVSSDLEEGQMHAKQLVIGTLVGAVTVLAIGYLIFTAVLGNFYAYAMNAGSATGVAREPQLFWAVALGALSYGALLTLVIGSRASSLTIGAGIKIGAIVSFLLWFTADFMLYGISNVGNLTTTIVDPLLELVPGAIAGGVIAGALKRMASPTRESPDVSTRRAA